MLETHLDKVDLNLLLVLHVLLEERSVTRAAARLGRSQPAVSRALARLRVLLDDPLLVWESGELLATPRAEALEQPLRQILGELEVRVLRSGAFDPAHSDRSFSIAAADYLESMVLPGLIASLSRSAPGIELAVTNAPRPMHELVEQVDLVIGPPGQAGAAMRTRKLGIDRFVVLVRDGNPEVGEVLDLETYLRLPHVLVSPRNTPGGTVDTALAAIGRTRRVAVRLPSFLVAPMVVAESDLLLTLPEGFARRAARRLPLRVLPPPLDLAPFTPTMGWHPRWHHDAGHSWFREQVVAASASLFG